MSNGPRSIGGNAITLCVNSSTLKRLSDVRLLITHLTLITQCFLSVWLAHLALSLCRASSSHSSSDEHQPTIEINFVYATACRWEMSVDLHAQMYVDCDVMRATNANIARPASAQHGYIVAVCYHYHLFIWTAKLCDNLIKRWNTYHIFAVCFSPFACWARLCLFVWARSMRVYYKSWRLAENATFIHDGWHPIKWINFVFCDHERIFASESHCFGQDKNGGRGRMQREENDNHLSRVNKNNTFRQGKKKLENGEISCGYVCRKINSRISERLPAKCAILMILFAMASFNHCYDILFYQYS